MTKILPYIPRNDNVDKPIPVRLSLLLPFLKRD